MSATKQKHKYSPRLFTKKKFAISYVIPAPGSAVIWLVTNTATLYSTINVKYIRGINCDITIIIRNVALVYFETTMCMCTIRYMADVGFHMNAHSWFGPSEIFCSLESIWASFCCRSASSPRPEKSTLKRAMMESTI